MNRAVVGLVMCGLVAGADASPGPSTIRLAEGWKDVTAELATTPNIVEAKRHMSELRGQMDVAGYVNDAGDELAIFYSAVSVGEPRKSQAEKLIEQGRAALAKEGPEISYTADWGTRYVVTTQKLRATPLLTVRGYIGFSPNGALLTVVARCVGNEASCDAAIAGVGVNDARFRPFDTLDELHEGIDSTTVLKIIGGICTIALSVLVAIKRKQSAAAG